MPDDLEIHESPKIFYFAYGSNIWMDQMNRRCPESKYVGTAELHEWRWIINRKGYASVIPSSEDRVLGFIYELNPKDEASLDVYENVNVNYEKRTVPVHLSTSPGDDETATKQTVQALIYIDFANTTPDDPKTEYIYRINMAMQDALKEGIPQSYIDKYIRPFIPPESQ